MWCATSPQLEDRGGVYREYCDIAIAVPADYPEPRGVRPRARDPEVAERLWRASEEWTGARPTRSVLTPDRQITKQRPR